MRGATTGRLAAFGRSAAVRFALGFAGLLALFYLIYIPVSQTDAYDGYLALVAQSAGAGARLVGQDAEVRLQTVVTTKFTFEIVPGCDGMEAIALFGSAVLASPVRFVARLIFLFAGVATLMAVNVVRLVTILFVGIHYPKMVDTMHWDLWPGVLIFAVLVCWLIWARWAVRHPAKLPERAGG